MRNEFADHGMPDSSQSRKRRARRREKNLKLLEVIAVVQNRVGRGVSYRPQVGQILGNGLSHSLKAPDLASIIGTAISSPGERCPSQLQQHCARHARPRKSPTIQSPVMLVWVRSFNQGKSHGSRCEADYALTAAASATSVVCTSGTNCSQSQPSLRQARTVPILVRFSTMNGAPHFGHGSAMGMCGDVKSQSG